MKNLIWIFILISPVTFAQKSNEDSISYGKSIIQILSSEQFSGRGYTENGMWKTGDFIATQFEKFGLKRLNHSYFQEFQMPINIIKNAELSINGKRLSYGSDFIVKPTSYSTKFHKNTNYFLDPFEFEKAISTRNSFIEFIQIDTENQKGKNVIFPPHKFEVDSLNHYYKNWTSFYRSEENKNRAILFFTEDKLTSSLSPKQDSIAEFIVKSTYFQDQLKIDDYKIESEFVPDFKARNIVGLIEGKRTDSLVVLTAHYDHLGKVGEIIFPGASDNASGTAFLLELAKYYHKKQPEFTTIFIAFASEEAGLVGSSFFVQNPLIDLKKIKFLVNFDIMGAGEDGIQIVNSAIFTREYEKIVDINSKNNYVKQIKKRGEACNSDHCPFYQNGVPSFFIYTLGGPGFYHDPFDKADSLDLVAFGNLKKLMIQFIDSL